MKEKFKAYEDYLKTLGENDGAFEAIDGEKKCATSSGPPDTTAVTVHELDTIALCKAKAEGDKFNLAFQY